MGKTQHLPQYLQSPLRGLLTFLFIPFQFAVLSWDVRLHPSLMSFFPSCSQHWTQPGLLPFHKTSLIKGQVHKGSFGSGICINSRGLQSSTVQETTSKSLLSFSYNLAVNSYHRDFLCLLSILLLVTFLGPQFSPKSSVYPSLENSFILWSSLNLSSTLPCKLCLSVFPLP